ncbi:hypothetical protein J2W49_005171 [Hydrogenophaga palleronii]|uniref:Uncharacterized protein n=1 Tax=Hydrogenophaga palleronii TaxID=65655 RepID=A0ABU1WV23_9BURK|nr:DUF6678 family protein [Hydrogenophaga palleronii]MDR7153191.1 hypothetical protein [Hydrogenophaga palleronii]
MNQFESLANNTKWNEFQQFLSDYGNNPYWKTQFTNGFVHPPTGWDADWTYHFRPGEHKFVKWCEMQPSATEGAPSLDEVAETCRRIGSETEVHE